MTWRWIRFFELHIEQGPILEKAEAQIGVVTSIQGLRWLDVLVEGLDGHAGTTPLDARKDALLAAAAIVVAINTAGREAGAEGRSALVASSRRQMDQALSSERLVL